MNEYIYEYVEWRSHENLPTQLWLELSDFALEIIFNFLNDKSKP